MNKRQKKKLKKRHTPKTIVEIRDITRIEGASLSDETLQKISYSVKKLIDTFKPFSPEDIPSIVPAEGFDIPYILDEDDKIKVYDIIFQEDNKNEQ